VIRLNFFLSLLVDLFRHLLTALLLSFTILTAGINGDCVMYDVCNTNGFVDQNCPYDGPGIPLNNPEAEKILQKLCPDFFSDRKKVFDTFEPIFIKFINFSNYTGLLHVFPSFDVRKFYSNG
jgi:hypothetical protein